MHTYALQGPDTLLSGDNAALPFTGLERLGTENPVPVGIPTHTWEFPHTRTHTRTPAPSVGARYLVTDNPRTPSDTKSALAFDADGKVASTRL